MQRNTQFCLHIWQSSCQADLLACTIGVHKYSMAWKGRLTITMMVVIARGRGLNGESAMRERENNSERKTGEVTEW